MNNGRLRVGWEETDITPPQGGSMPGYFQDRKATGVLDPLKAKVLFLGQGDESVALVALDLIALGAPEVMRIRQRVTELAKPAPRHVWVHCTHTHTGGMIPRKEMFTSDAEQIYPGLYPGVVDEQWVARLVENTARAVADAAAATAEEKKLTLHAGEANGVAFCRRYLMKDGSVRTNPGRGNPDIVRPAGEADPRVHVLKFADNRILAVVFGLHGDCIGGTQYSADWPYHLTEALRREAGADWRVIVFNAACGNINHIDVNNAGQSKGYDDSRRIGRTIARAAFDALGTEAPFTMDRLEAGSRVVFCKLRQPKPEDVRRAEELLNAPPGGGRDPFGFNEMFAPAVLILARTNDGRHLAEINALRVGSFGLAGMPGEYFVELAHEVEAGSPFQPTRTLGLTNGSMGYIPTREACEQAGYEAGYRSARYEPENGHRWARAAADLLKQMADAGGFL